VGGDRAMKITDSNDVQEALVPQAQSPVPPVIKSGIDCLKHGQNEATVVFDSQKESFITVVCFRCYRDFLTKHITGIQILAKVDTTPSASPTVSFGHVETVNKGPGD
jgi:predicted nucleic-acid-binding Zn-ribbon protein